MTLALLLLFIASLVCLAITRLQLGVSRNTCKELLHERSTIDNERRAFQSKYDKCVNEANNISKWFVALDDYNQAAATHKEEVERLEVKLRVANSLCELLRVRWECRNEDALSWYDAMCIARKRVAELEQSLNSVNDNRDLCR